MSSSTTNSRAWSSTSGLLGRVLPSVLRWKGRFSPGNRVPLLRASLWEYFWGPFCWKGTYGTARPAQDGIEP